MRITAAEKYEIIQSVTRSEIGIKRTLKEFGIARSTFYKWYNCYLKDGYLGFNPKLKQIEDNGILFHQRSKKW